MEISLWGRQVSLAFSTDMVAMGGAFALMGGVAGLVLGAWHIKKLESQRQQVALETLRKLMVTTEKWA